LVNNIIKFNLKINSYFINLPKNVNAKTTIEKITKTQQKSSTFTHFHIFQMGKTVSIYDHLKDTQTTDDKCAENIRIHPEFVKLGIKFNKHII